MDQSVLDFVTAAELLLLGVLMFGMVGFLVWAILRAAKYQPQAMLIVVLGVLAIVAALGYLLGGDDRAELVTLAATAVGALAAALTMLTRPTDGPGGPPPPGVAPDTTPDPIEPQRPPVAPTGDQEEQP